MATRTHAREAVVVLLYAYSSGNTDIRKFAPMMLEQKKIKNMQLEFALNLFDGVVSHLDDIDKIIIDSLKSWDFNRIGVIDKCIIRLGVYEMIFTNLDIPIIINEALEISKILGSDNTSRFVNGILDSIGKNNNIRNKG
ncbi:N utilization substance protein B [Helicobacter sp. 16-1353]|uniref:transcription antitermination factor NusB n=1 Tax=Helicobacter sp. 16-1353 TaxID=2004996 RepID=UPI000DCE8D80|nr:transcription antitermination factor NusB [Helicobacter sp. 16-1353]RAX54897.1 N utilization substance protein B [Helicobacter sp. 16-1353]